MLKPGSSTLILSNCALNTKIHNSQLLNISDALQLSPHTKLET